MVLNKLITSFKKIKNLKNNNLQKQQAPENKLQKPQITASE